jgi:acetyl-CoA C-acetyltransferase
LRNVFIAGVGQTPVVARGEIGLRQLAAAALSDAIASSQIDKASIDALYVGNMCSGVLGSQQQLGAVIAEAAGIPGVEALTCEAGCASGAAAARLAYLTVAGGMHDVVAVCGVELMSHVDKKAVTRALAFAADWELESSKGESFISLNASLMRAYMARYGVGGDAFAPFAISAHKNAFSNPNALLHKEIDAEAYRTSRVIIEPLRLFDASPVCDGAAVVIMAAESALPRVLGAPERRIQVSSSSMVTCPVALAHREDPLRLTAAVEATRRALRDAKLNIEDVDLFELHDAYTVMSVLSLEAAGLAKPGEGYHLGLEGRTCLAGDIPISTLGGLKGRGHPVGATGVYQLVEAYLQLAGQAGANQLKDPEIAMTQNLGGTGSTVVNHVLRRVK